ncbi:MAG: hypothetical protein FWD23_14260, partial [Oscillospiraceae bacterium]|nr:hypothetical protein [Oscillospiraceae bacterium]
MNQKAIAVSAPRYMEKWEMEEQFWNNFLLISNIQDREGSSGMEKGIVRYYSKDTAELYDLIMEMDKDDATYGSCMVKYIGNGDKNSVGGV